MEYTCKNCGAVADEPGHLCNPCGDKANCSFCGTPEVGTAHMCKDKLTAMKYVCDGCGRVAMEEGHLCKPSAISWLGILKMQVEAEERQSSKYNLTEG